tara:strand:- start:787 stop:1050 length:264 start_codon:yes stop_codon:yes gene_type:complete
MEKKEYLQTLKVQDLKKMCKENNILGVGKKKKAELIELMADCEIKGLLFKEEIILHLPIHPASPTPSPPPNFEKALARGKVILNDKK